MKSPAVPYHYRSRAIIAFGNFPFEVGVVQRMIFRLHRQPPVGVALGRSLGHGPRLQRSIDCKSEIVVQPCCPVLLNHERVAMLGPGTDFQLWQFRLWQARMFACRDGLALRSPRISSGPSNLSSFRFWELGLTNAGLPRRFRRSVEAAFSLVFFELGHGGILSQTFLRPPD